MDYALRTNRETSKQYETLLLVSALLHDAGNPALSHLGETFLKKQTGKDGESFLEETISRFAVTHMFDRLGIDPEQVVKIVTGNRKPFSDILNGSMDVDNLDNVGRYWFARSYGEILFDAESIASRFGLITFSDPQINDKWFLCAECIEETQKWQTARAHVYEKIYGEYDLNSASMIYRALYLAQERGEINEDFFHLSDTEAVDFLFRSNYLSAHLVRRAMANEWYPLVYSLKTTEPPAGLTRLLRQNDARSLVADYMSEQLAIPTSVVCCYAGKGRDVRRIELPFVSETGHITFDESDPKPVYRFNIYLDPDYVNDDRVSELTRLANHLIQ